MTEALLLVIAGVLAGVCGAVAGLASLVSFPALLATGLSPIAANVTNTVALVLSTVGSAAASQPELRGQRGRVRRLLAIAVAGGAVGSALLLLTPNDVFELVVPVLIAAGSALLFLQQRLLRLRGPESAERTAATTALAFGVAVYGGYFGAGAGIMMLAVLGISVPESLARVNALKNVSLGAANAVAATGFALFGPVRWAAAAPLAIGFLAGGAAGPALVRRLPERRLRVAVALAGLGLAARLGYGAYR